MTLNHVMVIILSYFKEFGSFWGQLHQRGSSQTHTFCNKNVAKRIYFLAIYDSILMPGIYVSPLIFLKNWPMPSFHYSSCEILCEHLSNSWDLVLNEFKHKQVTDRPFLNCPVSEGFILRPVSTTSKSFISRSGLATVIVRSGAGRWRRRVSVQ